MPRTKTEEYEQLARVGELTGIRSYTQVSNEGSAPLCDEYGRLLVVPSTAYGTPGPVGGLQPKGVIVERGSAPNKNNNDGIVGNQRVMLRPADIPPASPSLGVPYVLRMFGYVDMAGFVQLHLRDESGGANPPVLTNVPEVIIPINANQNFDFADYQLVSAATADLATYITFSSTGPTFTPAGNHIWFYFLGAV